jgi:hypothetical protein
MNQLFWKESRELRVLPIAALTAFLAISVAIILFEHNAHRTLNSVALVPGLIAINMLFWLYGGSSALSSEVGADTLQFVSMLPISRHRLWWVKLASSLCAAASVTLATGIAFWLLATFACPQGLSLGSFAPDHRPLSSFWTQIPLLLVGCVSVGLCASPFFDRPVSALVAAIVGGLLFQGLQFMIITYTVPHHVDLSAYTVSGYVVALLFTLTLPFISYQTFTRGESLRTIQKFKIGAVSAAAGIAATTLVFMLGNAIKLW